jgi:uncharacterized protein (DUF302 family)
MKMNSIVIVKQNLKMKKSILVIVTLIFGIIIGIVFSGIVVNISSGEMMIKEMKSPYDFEKTVATITERINAKDGWHVVTVIDQNSEVQVYGGNAIGKYDIIQYCSGKYSSDMLSADNRKKIGIMMPKSFGVYEKSEGQVYVATMNGTVMGKIFGGETERVIEKVSLEVEDIMRFINLKFTLF